VNLGKFKFRNSKPIRGFKISLIQNIENSLNATLVLEDGTTFFGEGFGYTGSAAGEIVFNTGMVGYTETLTDPSYRGQLLCLTYPLVGNYGIPSRERLDEFGMPKFFESKQIQILGLIVNEVSVNGSHKDCVKSLAEWLYEEGIPGISGVDTRSLTKKLRSKGVMRAALSVSNQTINRARVLKLAKSVNYNDFNFMPEVSVNESTYYGDATDPPIVLIDTGAKYSIIRNLLNLRYRVICVPWDITIDRILSYSPAGVVISNGPGDPKICKLTIETAVSLIDASIPTLGICLGNQIVALAGGADTYKLKFGHRGQNKACTETSTNRTYITSQNHGYGIDPKSLERTEFEKWFVNADDGTVEGIKHRSKPIIAVQFHPEASPGPYDCVYIFEKFKQLVDGNKKDGNKFSDSENG
jgi:carbamoyl-phosphate synthase small subunit